ncbi:ephrin type-A receptor 4-A-like [Lytechinus variegatus]|uniref:ephrin type-A receptor 4-A-like n=1 Tax=Lytechinus variegatus TaxID=7654 RepID=UPI001BB21D7E|nr:ephrin type-A receptor 4-A-like [Lytechinus variegatus]
MGPGKVAGQLHQSRPDPLYQEWHLNTHTNSRGSKGVWYSRNRRVTSSSLTADGVIDNDGDGDDDDDEEDYTDYESDDGIRGGGVFVVSVVDDGYCLVECQIGTFKSDIGITECSPCPAKSHADTVAVTRCTCIPDYYRAPGEEAAHPCTAPPSAPTSLTAVVDEKSSVVTLTWRNPENLGGRTDIDFRIECQRCPADVQFSSIQRIGQGYEVNVSRLSSHTTYEFRVHSYNEVSSQSTVDNFSGVNATTFSSVPSAVRDLKVVEDDVNDDSIKLRWRQPLFPNGEITNYQVIYRTSAETQENVKYHYQGVTDGEVQETTVHGLVPGTEYVFEVAANTASGVGAYSQQVLATTSGSGGQSVPTVILAAAVSAIFIIVVLVAVVIFLVFWRRKKEVPPSENGHLIYANGTNGEVILPPHIKKVKTYVDPFTYEDPNQAVKEFATEIDASQIRILEVIGGG